MSAYKEFAEQMVDRRRCSGLNEDAGSKRSIFLTRVAPEWSRLERFSAISDISPDVTSLLLPTLTSFSYHDQTLTENEILFTQIQPAKMPSI
jgi:hypothetical protein